MPHPFSHGPDPYFGPPCCRGVSTPCRDYEYSDYYGVEYEDILCGDTCCCCDPCRHEKLGPVDIGGISNTDECPLCCKCILKGIVGRFIPDEATGLCRERAGLLLPTDDGGRVVYSGAVPSVGEVTITIAKLPEYYDYYEQECEWKLEVPSLYLSESFLIDRRTVSCLHMPNFTPIEGVEIGDHCEPCTGTIFFEPYELAKISFRARVEDDYSPIEVPVECGDPYYGGCEEVCRVICVRRGTREYGEERITEMRHTFLWDAGSQSWKGGMSLGSYGSGEEESCGQEEISLVEVYGACYLELTAFEVETLEGDLILIDPDKCATGMDLFAEDYDGNWVAVSCNQCSCYEYLCGECRCTCETLCMVGGEGASVIGPLSLGWNDHDGCWGSEYEEYSEETVCIGTKSQPPDCTETGCQLVIAGFDPVDIDSACGDDLTATVINVDESTGVFSWRSVWCSHGRPCDDGTCLSACDDPPPVVMLDVEPPEWQPQLGCDPYELCFEPFTMPLFLVRNAPESAAEFSWKGFWSFSCKSCFGDYKTYILEVALGCDGSVFARLWNDDLTLFDENNTGVFVPNTPCSNCDEPFEETVDSELMPGECCDNAQSGFIFTFSEGSP